ncbi:TCR/Tet family MFS transporter [Candidatus Roizmanbacteria bacterium]|nr:TCR/Tet family MFS transporter [Candidatus Roizmanbacteria bacterium]
MKHISSTPSFVFICITAFLSVLGIGIIIPEIPFIVSKYMHGATDAQIAMNVGLLISIYSFFQFFAAPGLGALSDKYGRRPVLLFCLLGSAAGYVLFGIGGSIGILFLSRIIDGLTGGDLSTIFAYIADVTKPEERGKKFGLIGAIVGVGFMIGPTIGGLTSLINLSAPFYLAAAVTLLNAAFGYFVLPESLAKEHRMADFSLHHLNPFAQLRSVFSDTLIRTILLIGFFYFLPFSQLQGIGGIYSKDVLHWNPAGIGIYFFVIGIVDIITQGFLSGKLIHKFGELKLVLAGLFVTGLAYLGNASLLLFPSSILAYGAVIIFAFGSGLIEPSLGGLISRAASPKEQGRVQGANQSLQSITRIVGPLIAAYLYGIVPNAPYLSCAVLSAIAFGYVFSKRKTITHYIDSRVSQDRNVVSA